MRGVMAEGRQPSRGAHGAAARLAVDGRSRPRVARHGARAVQRGRGSARRRLRLRHEAQHRPDAGRARAAGSRVVPAERRAAEVRALKPDGLFLSNGPGDPAAVDYALEHHPRSGGGGLPTFGICLGHQLVGLAFGGTTAKLPYGHRGGNHPVRDLRGQVLITTQNHGFAVVGDADGVPGAPGARGHAPQSERRNHRRRSASRASALRRPIPPGSGSGTPRRLSPLCRIHGLARQRKSEKPQPLDRQHLSS